MKVFVIVMLSLAILQSLARMVEKAEDENAIDVIANFLMFDAYILALIFACQLH